MTEAVALDRLAYSVSRRLDGGGHGLEPERVEALRETLAQLRAELRALRRPARIWGDAAAMLVLIGVLLAVVYGVGGNVTGPWYAVFAAAFAAMLVAVVVLVEARSLVVALFRRRRRGGVESLVDDGADLAGSVDLLVRAVLARTRRAPRLKRVTAEHAEIALARVWSLVHGGPVARLDPVGRTRGGAAAAIAGRLHRLSHRALEEPAGAAEPGEVLHRIGRYDRARALLAAPRRRVDVGMVAALVAVAGLTGWLAVDVAGGRTPPVAALFVGLGAVLGRSYAVVCGSARGPKADGGTAQQCVVLRRELDAYASGLPEGDPAAGNARRARELLGEG